MPNDERFNRSRCPECGSGNTHYVDGIANLPARIYCASCRWGRTEPLEDYIIPLADWNAAHAEAQFAKRREAEARADRAEAALRALLGTCESMAAESKRLLAIGAQCRCDGSEIEYEGQAFAFGVIAKCARRALAGEEPTP
jgi:hypothetical protein